MDAGQGVDPIVDALELGCAEVAVHRPIAIGILDAGAG
jgi:hypothetical protein